MSKIASVFVTSLLLVAAVSTPVRAQTPQTVQSQSLADGQRLYGVNCANCHGARAQGAVKAGSRSPSSRSGAANSRPTSPIRRGITARPTRPSSPWSRRAFPRG